MTKRPPTPTGWSDTDWVKKLQDDEENPLACLHINQGSFDAAADAYEEEYKMSKCTAMDIADALEVEMPTLKNMDDAAAMLRSQHAEIERLTAIIAKDGYAELWAECYTLRCEIKGPDGFETWKDAAVHERREMFKVKAEAKRLTKERDAAIAAAVAAERDACAAVCENGNFLHDAAPTAIFGKECARAIRARSAT